MQIFFLTSYWRECSLCLAEDLLDLRIQDWFVEDVSLFWFDAAVKVNVVVDHLRGELFFYWLEQAIILHLVDSPEGLAYRFEVNAGRG